VIQYTIQGKNYQYELVIGCEIHAQIATNSKLFSRSSTKFGNPQNSQASFVDVAMPGMLPVINKSAVLGAIKTGLGLNAKINLKSIFDRKNYFYADLPQGYQISQFSDPIVGQGFVEVEIPTKDQNGDKSSYKKRVGITRLHLEQDAGKSIHDQHPTLSLIDLNRSGVALMEIVSDPDITTPIEAAEYVKKIRAIVRALGTCDGDMEKGNLRCDANVSVRRVGETKLGTRCEIKNLNSTRNIIRAIEFEAKRQVDIVDNGGVIDQQTRLFDAINGETRMMRSKEDAMDYRYFPDPDLPPLIFSQDLVDEIKGQMPELPDAKKERYIKDFDISPYDARVLTMDIKICKYFETLIAKHEPRLCITWLNVELLGRMNKENINFENLKISANNLVQLLDLIKDGTISGKIAKDVLDEMLKNGEEPIQIINKLGLKQVSDLGSIEIIIDLVIKNNPEKVIEYKSGKNKLFGFFVGQVMKESRGQANPNIVNNILKTKLQ
jgi:aspartyl-tRNA(Asn)/glutamyl-tRNA(Gln) amidotransferase subunit B